MREKDKPQTQRPPEPPISQPRPLPDGRTDRSTYNNEDCDSSSYSGPVPNDGDDD